MHSRYLLLVLALLTTSCFPYACGNGAVGPRIFPWTLRTQYAFVDKKEAQMENGRRVFRDRADDAGGEVLFLHMYGFTFNPRSDRRNWTAEQWLHFQRGIETQPYVVLSVQRVNKMSNGDKVEFDTEGTTTPTLSDPVLAVDYSPGNPGLRNQDEYPDKQPTFGSHRKGTLTLSGIADEPGPLGWLRGSLEYSVAKGTGDPDDVETGEFTINFSAQVLGERLAECNENRFSSACEAYDN